MSKLYRAAFEKTMYEEVMFGEQLRFNFMPKLEPSEYPYAGRGKLITKVKQPIKDYPKCPVHNVRTNLVARRTEYSIAHYFVCPKCPTHEEF